MSITTLKYAMVVGMLGAVLAVLTLSLVKIAKTAVTSTKLSIISDMKQGIRAKQQIKFS